MDGVSVRPMRIDDLRKAQALRLRGLKAAPDAFGARYQDEAEVSFEEQQQRALELLANDRRDVLVAEQAGQLVGLCFVHFLSDEPACADVGGMWVDEAYRGLGIGRRLLVEAESWSVSRDATEVVLWVTDGNGNALGLYESEGFRRTGKEAAHPIRTWLTVLELRKQLSFTR